MHSQQSALQGQSVFPLAHGAQYESVQPLLFGSAGQAGAFGVHVLVSFLQVSPVSEHTASPHLQGTLAASAVPSVVLHSATGTAGVHVLVALLHLSPVVAHTAVPHSQGTVVAAVWPSVLLHSSKSAQVVPSHVCPLVHSLVPHLQASSFGVAPSVKPQGDTSHPEPTKGFRAWFSSASITHTMLPGLRTISSTP
jgi:hypothetical protein